MQFIRLENCAKEKITENTSKSVSEWFTIMTSKLGELRTELPLELQTISFMRSKILLACKGVEHCLSTFANPWKDLGNLISNFANSISAREAVLKNSSAFWIDRKYRRESESTTHKPRNNQHKPRCYICEKKVADHGNILLKDTENARNRHVNSNRFRNFDRSSPKFENKFSQWSC